MKKGIFSKLGAKKEGKSTLKPQEKFQPLKTITAETIRARYRNFDAICDDVARDTTYGAKLLQCILADQTLFVKYIYFSKDLKRLVSLCPSHDQIDVMIQHIKSDPHAEEMFLGNLDSLVDNNALFTHCRGPQYQDDLVKHALSKKAIYSGVLSSENQMQKALEKLPQFEDIILEILARDIDIFVDCVGRLPFYCEFCKKHEKYRAHFVKLACTSEAVFESLSLTLDSNFSTFVDHFPEAEVPLIDFILADDALFNRAFGSFDAIYRFCKKRPQNAQHLEKLFAKAISLESYVRSNMKSIRRLIEVHDENPRHAQIIETMILADPKWVVSMPGIRSEIPKLEHPAFTRLRKAYFDLLYLNPDSFSMFPHIETELDEMIKLAPDQEVLLRFYYQFHRHMHALKKSLHEIHAASFENTATLVALKEFIQTGLQQGTLSADTLKAVHAQVDLKLAACLPTASHYAALNDLKECLDYNLAPKIASLLHKGTLIAEKSTEQKEEATPMVPPILPGGTHSN